MQPATYVQKVYRQFGHIECKAIFWYNAHYFTDRLKVTNTEIVLSLLIFILRGKYNNYQFQIVKCFKGS